MRWIGAVIAIAMILVIFVDAFEAVVLPRRIKHNYRLARLFYHSTWVLWRAIARLLPRGKRRSAFLSVFGPLSIFGLLTVWAIGLILGFALLHWSFQTALALPGERDDRFVTYVYFSGTTFFTLGYGDIVPTRSWGRALSVAESGLGFGFLALILSYVPVQYQAFSRREISISLLDARAGSPPTAGELLRRQAESRNLPAMGPFLVEWERWCAELLEGQLSSPVVSFYRSQHDNQSWVAALAMMLDTSALLIAAINNAHGHQARLTFAMARHAAVDLCLVFRLQPSPSRADRLSPATFDRLRASLTQAGLELTDGMIAGKALTELRGLYEPFISSLADYFSLELPPFQPETQPIDNWQTSPWMPCSPTLSNLPGGANADIDEVH